MRLHGEQTSLRCGEPSACPACPFFCICISQFPAVFLYLCTYLISLELHPDLYQVVNVRELHHNCSSSSLDLRRKHLKLESWISLENNIRHHENNNFTLWIGCTARFGPISGGTIPPRKVDTTLTLNSRRPKRPSFSNDEFLGAHYWCCGEVWGVVLVRNSILGLSSVSVWGCWLVLQLCPSPPWRRFVLFLFTIHNSGQLSCSNMWPAFVKTANKWGSDICYVKVVQASGRESCTLGTAKNG